MKWDKYLDKHKKFKLIWEAFYSGQKNVAFSLLKSPRIKIKFDKSNACVIMLKGLKGQGTLCIMTRFFDQFSCRLIWTTLTLSYLIFSPNKSECYGSVEIERTWTPEQPFTIFAYSTLLNWRHVVLTDMSYLFFWNPGCIRGHAVLPTKTHA